MREVNGPVCGARSRQGNVCVREPNHIGCHEVYVDGDGRRWWGDAAYDSRPDTYEHISQVRGYLIRCATKLLERGHRHDNSKLRPPEVEYFDELTPRLKDAKYGSDEYRDFLEELKPALDHHYSVNDHHPEYFDAPYVISPCTHMNLLQLLEMLCDWKAATKRMKDGDIRKSIEINQERFGYSDELKQILLNTLEEL